jgi:hypothetical protein
MLYYEKRRKEPMKIVVPDNIAASAKALDCDGTANSSVTTILPAANLVSVCPQLSLERLKAPNLELFYDSDKKEYYT